MSWHEQQNWLACGSHAMEFPARRAAPARLFGEASQANHEHYQKLGSAQASRKPWPSGYGKLKTTIRLG